MDSQRVMFVVIGVLIVIAAGQLLAMSGRRHLGRAAGSAAVLVSVLFHVVTFGVVALLTVLPFGGSSVDGGLMLRLGVLLIALAIVFGGTMILLSRRVSVVDTEVAHGHAVRPDRGA